MNRCFTFSLDEDLINRVSNTVAEKRKLSNRINTLIEYGMMYEALKQEQKPTLNDCIEQLIAVYKEQGTPITTKKEEPKEKEQPKQNNIDEFTQKLLTAYKEDYEEDEFNTDPLLADDVVIKAIQAGIDDLKKLSIYNLSKDVRDELNNDKEIEEALLKLRLNKLKQFLYG